MIGALAVLHAPAGPYTLPALRHPTLLFVLRGGLAVQPPGPPGAPWLPLAPAGLCGATRQARRVCAEPGTRLALVAVRPGQLQRLLGVTAEDVLDVYLPLRDLLPTAVEALWPHLHKASSDTAACVAIEDFLTRGAGRFQHHAAGLAVPDHRLALPVAELAAAHGLGLRQFERRFRQSHGQSLRAWRAHTRCNAMLCATVQGQPGLHDWRDLQASGGYADQPHLIRAAQRFAGHSPGELTRRAPADPALWLFRQPLPLVQQVFGGSAF